MLHGKEISSLRVKMGSKAKTLIWAGYRAAYYDLGLPDDILEKFENDDEIDVGDVVICTFKSMNEHVGIGVELMSHDWCRTAKRIDLNELTEKATDRLQAISRIFKTWGIDDKPGIFLTSDFS